MQNIVWNLNYEIITFDNDESDNDDDDVIIGFVKGNITA